MTNCFCGNSLSFQDCCEPYIKGIKKAPTAEALMRSRYCAFVTAEIEYLGATTHVSTRKFHKKFDVLAWAKNNQWLKLEIIETSETTVTFNAYYLDKNLKARVHNEHSNFILENGIWFYVDGEY